MANYVSLGILGSNEMDVTRSQVEINGALRTDLFCEGIERTPGIEPSKARLRYIPGLDVSGPVTLSKCTAFRFGQRVRVYSGDPITGDTLFLGSMIRREDSGASDAVQWIAGDDRWLMAQMPLRGCLIRDSDGTVKYSSRHDLHLNPSGVWNCIGAKLGNTVVPVFSPLARRVYAYDAPNEAYPDLAEGKLCPWTPRRALWYLWLVANISSGPVTSFGIKGFQPAHWRSIYGSARIEWDQDFIDAMINGSNVGAPASIDCLSGLPPGSTQQTDPLDRKCPDISLQGVRLLQGIKTALDAAGTHSLRMAWAAPASGQPVRKSKLDFYTLGWSPMVAEDSQAVNCIRLQRGGAVTDINTGFDFTLHEDVSELCESVLVEGDTVRVETPLTYTRTAPTTSTLVPAWDDAQEGRFWDVLRGTGGTGNFARVPLQQNQLDTSGWTNADGNSGRPLATKNTQGAMQLAREFYPTVYLGYRVNSDNLSALGGVNGEYDGTNNYPRLKYNRPVLPEQAQFFTYDSDGTTSQEDWVTAHYPVRAQFNGAADGTNWYDAGPNIGLRVTPDGIIWLDGLAEQQNKEKWCTYEGDAYSTAALTKKSVKLNAVVPMDHRVVGYESIQTGTSALDPSHAEAIDGGLNLAYIDAPAAYHEIHQVNSAPTASTRYDYGSGYSTAPLTRYLPPGSERTHALYHAQRKLSHTKVPQKQGTWRLIGIRPEYDVGMWLDSVSVFGHDGSSGDADYPLRCTITRVSYDFVAQQTIIGGSIMIPESVV